MRFFFEEGGGHLLKRGVFSGTYGSYVYSDQTPGV